MTYNNTQEGNKKRVLSPFLEEERMLRRIPLEIIALSFIVAILALPFFDPLTSLFILAGGSFAALSFVWLKQSVSRLFLPQKGEKGDSPSKEEGQSPFSRQSPFFAAPFSTTSNYTTKALRSALLLYALRLVLILGIFFIIIFFFSKKIIAFAAGFSTLVPVFLVEAAIALSRMKQWKS